MKLFEIFGEVAIDNRDAIKSLDSTDSAGKKADKSLGKAFGSIAKASAIATAAIVGVGAAVLKFAGDAAKNADEVDKMSQKIGISRKAYQEWAFVLSQSGADVNQLQTSMKTLAKAADEANNGVDTYAESFNRLGVSVTDSSGKLKSQEDLLKETIIALQGMDDQTQRTAIASELLGRSATELGPLLNAGAGATEELTQKAHELGLVLGDDVVDAGVEYTDTIDQMKRSSGALFTGIMADLLPVLNEMFQNLIDNLPEIKKNVEETFNKFVAAMEPVWKVVEENLIPIFEDLWAFTQDSVIPIFEDLWKVFVEDILPIMVDLHTKVKDFLMPIFERLWGIFQEKLIPILADLWSIVKDDIIPIFQKFWDMIEPIAKAVADVLVIAFESALDIIGGVIGAIKDAFEWAEKAIEKIKEFFTLKNDGDDYATDNSVMGSAGQFLGNVNNTSSSTVINVNNPNLFNTSDADALGDLMVEKLNAMGVN